MALSHKQTVEDVQSYIDALVDHGPGRLADIVAPTLVLAGGRFPASRPELSRAVADSVPGARFEVLAGEVHQPFQEMPDEWNSRVDAFWREVDRR